MAKANGTKRIGFTGWADVPLSEKGENEAREAGRLIKNAGIKIDLAFFFCFETSYQNATPV